MRNNRGIDNVIVCLYFFLLGGESVAQYLEDKVRASMAIYGEKSNSYPRVVRSSDRHLGWV